MKRIPEKWFKCNVSSVFGDIVLLFNSDSLELAKIEVYAWLSFGTEKLISPVVEIKKGEIKGMFRSGGDEIHSVFRKYPD